MDMGSVGSDTLPLISGSGLNISTPEREVSAIQQENLARMADMTQQEILEEQKKLLETLGGWFKYSDLCLSGHSQQSPPSLIRPYILSANTVTAFTSPPHQRLPL